MPFRGPYTPGELSEPDDFVRQQLMLIFALTNYFNTTQEQSVTHFRDELLGIGVFYSSNIEKLQGIVCVRPSLYARLTIVGALTRIPGWGAYNQDYSLGVSIDELDNSADRDSDDSITVGGRYFKVSWDTPRPPSQSVTPAPRRSDRDSPWPPGMVPPPPPPRPP
jgi:hypothetical protein